MISVHKTNLEKVLLVRPDIFEDHRGQFIEIYNEGLYHEHGIKIKFIQDDISISDKNVLRGIHGDEKTWKLVSCLMGKFYLVVVNCEKKSVSFGKWEAFVLSDVNKNQVLIPPKYGNAHLVLSKKAIFHYKQSTYYDPESQFTYIWNDPTFNIWWPIDKPILSIRDQKGDRKNL